MAIRKEIIFVDDIDGEKGAETLTFALDGKDYKIDLVKENAAKLREALAPYIAVGRPIKKKGKPAPASKQSGLTVAELRKKAKELEISVPDRGRLSNEVRQKILTTIAAEEANRSPHLSAVS